MGLDPCSADYFVGDRMFIPRDLEVNSFKMNRPMKFAMANEEVKTESQMMMDAIFFGNAIDPLVLENTIKVPSLGRLVLDNRYGFRWTKEHGPTLVID